MLLDDALRGKLMVYRKEIARKCEEQGYAAKLLDVKLTVLTMRSSFHGPFICPALLFCSVKT
jgi:hypothetical protein